MGLNQENPITTEQKRRSPGVKGLHRVTLKSALDIPRAVYEIGGGDPVPRAIALDHLGRVAKSGASDQLVGASNYYGLTRSRGNNLELTERGFALMQSEIDELARTRLLHDALFSNDIFAALVARYADKTFPMDKSALLYLTATHNLNETDANIFWDVTKSNLEDFGLTQDLSSGGKIIISREKSEKKLRTTESEPTVPPSSNVSSDNNVPESSTPELLELPVITPKKPSGLTGIAPQFQFNIQIQLPENASEDVYQAIFRNISKYLLGHDQE